MASKTVKVTVGLPAELMNEIKEIANKRGSSVTEIIRRGLEIERLFDKENGSRLLLERQDKSLAQLLWR